MDEDLFKLLVTKNYPVPEETLSFYANNLWYRAIAEYGIFRVTITYNREHESDNWHIEYRIGGFQYFESRSDDLETLVPELHQHMRYVRDQLNMVTPEGWA